MSVHSDKEQFDITQDLQGSRFVARAQDGEIAGYVAYELSGGGLFNKGLSIPSTVVDPRFKGQGVASALTVEAFSWARKIGATVNPICSFTAGFIDRNPIYQDLLAEQSV